MTEPSPDAVRCFALLRAVIAAIDAGEIDASEGERAYLAGAADALRLLSGPVPEPSN